MRLVGVAERAVRLVGVAVRAVLLRLVGVDAAATGAVAFGMLAAPLAFGEAVADAAFGVAGAPTFLIGVLSSATASSRRGEGLRAIIGGDCWRATCTSVSACRLVMLLPWRPLALGVLGAGMWDERSSFDFEKLPGARDSAFETLNVLETGSATSSPFKRDTTVTVDVDRESSPSFRDR